MNWKRRAANGAGVLLALVLLATPAKGEPNNWEHWRSLNNVGNLFPQIVGIQQLPVVDWLGYPTTSITNPSTGRGRFFYSTTDNQMHCLNSDGSSCLSSAGAGGTVTNIATTGPIGGGPITTTGTITCTTCATSAGSETSGNVVTGAGGKAIQDSGVALSALQTTANVSAGCISGCYYALGLGDGATAAFAAGSALGTANQPAFFRIYNSQARSITTGCFEVTVLSAAGNADVAVYSVSGTALTRIWHTGAKSTTNIGAQCGTATVANLAAGQNYYVAFCADNIVATVGQLVGNAGGIPAIMGGANAPNTYGLNATDVSTGGVCPASATTTNITNNSVKLLATGLEVFN